MNKGKKYIMGTFKKEILKLRVLGLKNVGKSFILGKLSGFEVTLDIVLKQKVKYQIY